MTNTCDLEAWIKKRRLTRQQLAGLIGISPMSLYRKIHNRSEFRAGEIAAITRVLQLSRKDRDHLFFDASGDLESRKVRPRRIGSMKGRWLSGSEGAPLPELPGQLTLEGTFPSRQAEGGSGSGGRSGKESGRAAGEKRAAEMPSDVRKVGEEPRRGPFHPAEKGGRRLV